MRCDEGSRNPVTVATVDSERLDGRATRFEHGVVALTLLAGFTFELPWTLPLAAGVTAVGAVFGPRGAPLVRVFVQMMGPRIPPAEVTADPTEWRWGAALEAAVLGLATLLMFGSLIGLAWILGLAVAGIDALDGATGVNLSARVVRHGRERR